jgi:hypothetical protein
MDCKSAKAQAAVMGYISTEKRNRLFDAMGKLCCEVLDSFGVAGVVCPDFG